MHVRVTTREKNEIEVDPIFHNIVICLLRKVNLISLS